MSANPMSVQEIEDLIFKIDIMLEGSAKLFTTEESR